MKHGLEPGAHRRTGEQASPSSPGDPLASALAWVVGITLISLAIATHFWGVTLASLLLALIALRAMSSGPGLDRASHFGAAQRQGLAARPSTSAAPSARAEASSGRTDARRAPGAPTAESRLVALSCATPVRTDDRTLDGPTSSATAARATRAVGLVRLHTLGDSPALTRPVQTLERVAVVVNPSKVDVPELRAKIDDAVALLGWPAPRWLETAPHDHGERLARRAAEEGATRVIAIGGDGTVREVCAGLAHSGAVLGIIPAGTGNLLARNLGIPLDADEAIAAALLGDEGLLDVLEWESDGRKCSFVTMGGAGLDARTMASTRSALKRHIGALAYVHAAARHLNRPRVGTRVVVDGRCVHDGGSTLVLVGNVGSLQHGPPILPDAAADNGTFAVMIASPSGVREWASIARAVITGEETEHMQRFTGRALDLSFSEPVPFQLDGDVVAESSTARVTIQPQAVRVAVIAGARANADRWARRDLNPRPMDYESTALTG